MMINIRFMLAATGVAALATFGSVATASAAVTHTASAAVGKTYSVEEAGYQASGTGWRFRYAQATVKLPDSSKSPYTGGEGESVQLRASDETIVLGVSTTQGGTGWNAAVAVEQQFGQGGCGTAAGCFTHVNGNSPTFATGDSVSFSLYYVHSTGYLYYTATDNTSGKVFSSRFLDPGALFTSARIGTEFGVDPWTAGTGYTAPTSTKTLASFTAIRFTSYDGTKGFIGGAKWTTDQILTTSTGTSAGVVIAAPSVPAKNAATAFSVSAVGSVAK